ncbi:hypothetical protein KBC31_02920 [Candidatus Saccharibacteria bacterium]|jgi:hypothetical protein|nr:hypothetical protein [Candidatus Saccharibacteria bacterium]
MRAGQIGERIAEAVTVIALLTGCAGDEDYAISDGETAVQSSDTVVDAESFELQKEITQRLTEETGYELNAENSASLIEGTSLLADQLVIEAAGSTQGSNDRKKKVDSAKKIFIGLKDLVKIEQGGNITKPDEDVLKANAFLSDTKSYLKAILYFSPYLGKQKNEIDDATITGLMTVATGLPEGSITRDYFQYLVGKLNKASNDMHSIKVLGSQVLASAG